LYSFNQKIFYHVSIYNSALIFQIRTANNYFCSWKIENASRKLILLNQLWWSLSDNIRRFNLFESLSYFYSLNFPAENVLQERNLLSVRSQKGFERHEWRFLKPLWWRRQQQNKKISFGEIERIRFKKMIKIANSEKIGLAPRTHSERLFTVVTRHDGFVNGTKLMEQS
jgi:hypothetical protein